MEISSFDDCESVGDEFGLPAELVAHAYGINDPSIPKIRERLSSARSQKERWYIYEDVEPVCGSAMEEMILQEILKNATDQNERFLVLGEATTGSEIERLTMETINRQSETDLANATTLDGLLTALAESLSGSEVEKDIVRAICARA